MHQEHEESVDTGRKWMGLVYQPAKGKWVGSVRPFGASNGPTLLLILWLTASVSLPGLGLEF